MRTLSEVGLAGWTVGLTLAAALIGDRLLRARRRSALNRALHELRRPLQTLALAPATADVGSGPNAAQLALAALDDLDHEVNGSSRSLSPRPVACRALVEAAVERWRAPAANARRSLELRWSAGAAVALVDPRRVAQALDNLIANAIEHGGLRVRVEVTIAAGRVRISVSNAALRAVGDARRDARHGHGLRVVASVAAAHGGRFGVQRPAGAWVAILELPLAPTPVTAANGGRGAADRAA